MMGRTITLELPKLGFIISTRAALAFGAGLLMSERVPATRRRAVGLTLMAGGILATVPAAHWVRQALHRDQRPLRDRYEGASVEQDARLVGVTRFPRRGDHELSG